MVTITGTISNEQLDRHIEPADSLPRIPADAAFDLALKKLPPLTPESVRLTHVIWNGLGVWVVSFQGGDVCPPVLGYPGSDSTGYCAGNAYNVRIDAESGEWLNTFSDGLAVPRDRVAAEPQRTMDELLYGDTLDAQA